MIISGQMNAALNEQIGNEFSASLQYVAIAAYFGCESLPELASHFYRQAEEERAHAMRVVRFMVETLLRIVQRAGEQGLLHVEEYLARQPSLSSSAES